jgi:hypothetical protein
MKAERFIRNKHSTLFVMDEEGKGLLQRKKHLWSEEITTSPEKLECLLFSIVIILQ